MDGNAIDRRGEIPLVFSFGEKMFPQLEGKRNEIRLDLEII